MSCWLSRSADLFTPDFSGSVFSCARDAGIQLLCRMQRNECLVSSEMPKICCQAWQGTYRFWSPWMGLCGSRRGRGQCSALLSS